MRFSEIKAFAQSHLGRGLSGAELKELVGQVAGKDGRLNKSEQKQLEKFRGQYESSFTAAGAKAFAKEVQKRIGVDRGSGGGRTSGSYGRRTGGGRGSGSYTRRTQPSTPTPPRTAPAYGRRS